MNRFIQNPLRSNIKCVAASRLKLPKYSVTGKANDNPFRLRKLLSSFLALSVSLALSLKLLLPVIGSKYPVLAGKEYDALVLEQNVRKTQKTKKIIKYIFIFFICIYPLHALQ